jgi:hypothetical protein
MLKYQEVIIPIMQIITMQSTCYNFRQVQSRAEATNINAYSSALVGL